jgi:putative DNA primase/helicase
VATAVGFSKAMEDRGFEKKTSNGVQWLGIEMIRTIDDFRDAPSEPGDGQSPPRTRWDEDDLP